LNHKVGNDAMEREFVVKAFAGKFHKIGTGIRCFVVEKFQFDPSA